jgi:hypothetical protein
MAHAAYSGMNPRMMLRLIETGLFSHAEIADELTFSGMRPASQERMLRAAPYLATQPQRTALRSEIEKAAAAGLIDDTDMLNRIDAAEHDTDRNSLIVARVKLEQLQKFAADLENEYSTLWQAGLIDEVTYRADLAGIGLQQWRVDGLTARGEARQAATLARQEAAAARALAKATTAAERKVAIQNFLAGNINAAELAAALILTGLTPIQAAAQVDLAVLQKEGKPRNLYGMSLSGDAASLLNDRVRALLDQRKRNLISDQQFTDGLRNLGLSSHFINALRAQADATLTPKKEAYVVPVETSPASG